VAIRIEERFAVQAPVEAVWAYLVDPRRVVTCLPGAELTEVQDERTFLGNVKVKVGTITVSYRGRVHLAEVDVPARRVKMTGEGQENTGTGSAKMTMESRLGPAPGGACEVVVQAELNVVGRIVQLGRGMIEQVAHQLFQQFAACVRATLEAEAAARAAPVVPGAAAAAPPPAPAREEAVRALPLLMRTLWAWLVGLFRRRAGGSGRA
jgi:carbon monoxide dehydrogenase subunit G